MSVLAPEVALVRHHPFGERLLHIAPAFPAQIPASQIRTRTPEQRAHRLAALSTELYGDNWLTGLTRDLRVTERTVRRWKNLETAVPVPVLVALGAMLAVDRVERVESFGLAELL